MPLNANIIDVIQFVNDRPDLHNGAPFKFLAAQGRLIILSSDLHFGVSGQPKKTMSLQLRLEERRRERAQMQRNEGSWTYAMNEIDRQGLCPDQIAGLEEWDYGSSEDLTVTISDRKILLKEKVSVDHIEITGTGMLIFGQPNIDAVELRAKGGVSNFQLSV